MKVEGHKHTITQGRKEEGERGRKGERTEDEVAGGA